MLLQVLQVLKPAAAVKLGFIPASSIKEKANLNAEQAKDLVLTGVVPAVDGVRAKLIALDDAYSAKLLTGQDYKVLLGEAAAAGSQGANLLDASDL